MTDYKAAGLALQKAALSEQFGRVSESDQFARMLLLGKIKALQRELNGLPSAPFEFKGSIYQRDWAGKITRLKTVDGA